MANKLNELEPNVTNEAGRDIDVIEKQIKMEVGTGSKVFEIVLWCLLIIPGLVFLIKKVSASNNLDKLEQRIQAAASEIDNALEQRVIVLQNAAAIVKQSVDLDKTTFVEIAKSRSKVSDDNSRNDVAEKIDTLNKQVNVAFEAYPDLKAHSALADAMQKNDYLQREITATRTNYNDLVSRWNQNIQAWPTYKIVAAKKCLTTRIPFTASSEVKEQARSVFF